MLMELTGQRQELVNSFFANFTFDEFFNDVG
jgi:hypothetical protein